MKTTRHFASHLYLSKETKQIKGTVKMVNGNRYFQSKEISGFLTAEFWERLTLLAEKVGFGIELVY